MATSLELSSSDFLNLAAHICQQEKAAIDLDVTVKNHNIITWRPLLKGIFSRSLVLSDIRQSSEPSGQRNGISSVTFVLDGDEMQFKEEVWFDFSRDSYAQYYYEEFATTYKSHPHEQCLQIVAKRIKEKKTLDEYHAGQSEAFVESVTHDKHAVTLEDVRGSL